MKWALLSAFPDGSDPVHPPSSQHPFLRPLVFPLLGLSPAPLLTSPLPSPSQVTFLYLSFLPSDAPALPDLVPSSLLNHHHHLSFIFYRFRSHTEWLCSQLLRVTCVCEVVTQFGPLCVRLWRIWGPWHWAEVWEERPGETAVWTPCARLTQLNSVPTESAAGEKSSAWDRFCLGPCTVQGPVHHLCTTAPPSGFLSRAVGVTVVWGLE